MDKVNDKDVVYPLKHKQGIEGLSATLHTRNVA